MTLYLYLCGQRMICDHIRTLYPLITTIFYLSDGCSAHFKNNFSMLNLIKHREDYQFQAEWIFLFSKPTLFHIQIYVFIVSSIQTSHGKGPVDRLEAVVKSAARRQTMRADGPQKSLLTTIQLYEFLKQKFSIKSKVSTTNTSSVNTENIVDTERI